MKNRKLKLALLTALPAILFWLAWPPRDLFFLSFVAFVPLFMLERETTGMKGGGWLIYLALLLWNAAISWWVWNAEATSSIVMMTANAAMARLSQGKENDVCKQGVSRIHNTLVGIRILASQLANHVAVVYARQYFCEAQ